MNVLIYYVTQYEIKERELAEKLISATENKKLNGFIVPSIESEFDGILSDNSIAKAQSIVNSIVENCNNSKPKLMTKLDNYPSVVGSEEIVLRELKFKVESEKSFTTESAKLKLIELGRIFKIRRNKLLSTLKKIDSKKFNEISNKFINEISRIRTAFEKLFPIKETKDTSDNEHIVNSSLCCKMWNVSGTFITNDNLRVKPAKNFSYYCSKAKKSVRKELGVTLFIENLEKYCKIKLL